MKKVYIVRWFVESPGLSSDYYDVAVFADKERAQEFYEQLYPKEGELIIREVIHDS